MFDTSLYILSSKSDHFVQNIDICLFVFVFFYFSREITRYLSVKMYCFAISFVIFCAINVGITY